MVDQLRRFRNNARVEMKFAELGDFMKKGMPDRRDNRGVEADGVEMGEGRGEDV